MCPDILTNHDENAAGGIMEGVFRLDPDRQAPD